MSKTRMSKTFHHVVLYLDNVKSRRLVAWAGRGLGDLRVGDAAHCEEEHDNPWMTECRQGGHSHGPFKRSLQDEAPEKWYVPDCAEREKRGHAQAPTECGGCPDEERAEDARGCRSEVRNDVFGHVDGRGPVDDGRQWSMEDAKRCLFLLLG